MASVQRSITLATSPEVVWDAVADIGAVHTRLARGFVVDTVLGQGQRTVTFANGLRAKELIVDKDDHARRLVWAVVESERLSHYNASLQVFPANGGSRVVWVADFLPDDSRDAIAGMIDAGMSAIKATMDKATPPQ